MNNLYQGLMAYRQRAQQRGQRASMGGGIHQPQQSGGYDSSGINPQAGGGFHLPTGGMAQQPMTPPPAPSMPFSAPQTSMMQQPPPMQPHAAPASPAPMQPPGGGYDSSGINPGAGRASGGPISSIPASPQIPLPSQPRIPQQSQGRPFQLQGGFGGIKPDPTQNPVLIRNTPATF